MNKSLHMVLRLLGITALIAGGLAIAIGELVDDAVVDVENILRLTNHRARILGRNEADPQLGVAHLNSSAAMITDWATSAIFLFSFIAVLRSST